MKNIRRKLIYGLSTAVLSASSVVLTGCIDEAELTNGVSQEQVSESNTAKENLLLAIPAYTNEIWNSSYAFSWGYGAVMHVRDVETEDMGNTDVVGYNWFASWAENSYMGRDYVYGQWLWNYQYSCINAVNLAVAAIDADSEDATDRGYLGAALAYRAMFYLDLAREYEWLPNDATQPLSPEGNNIEGLTVPIVRDGMSEDEQRVNPRASKEEMAEFILEDLTRAVELIPDLTLSDKTLPHLDCVYGLLARYYMWLEDYTNAERYARMAINETSTAIISESEALNTSSGFNTLSQFMWGSQYTTSSLQSNLLNWSSWMSNEAQYGYTSLAPITIDAAMYQRISDTDWRKLMWKAPEGSALDGQNTYIDTEYGEQSLPEYASLKFRPGSGETGDYSIGSAVAYPLMRVEEMYFIEAEAAAHQDAARGRQLLESFMTAYRDANYTCSATSTDDVVEEIVFQKRVELWGEGQTFFDIKRLDYAVTRGYEGTNHVALERLNTTTRPAWMNWVFVITEENNNSGVRGYNNPDPTDAYSPWTGN